MARSLIKKELGEFVEVETPGGIKEYEITEIKLV
jgi:transcription elongation GreA/GreB family factor